MSPSAPDQPSPSPTPEQEVPREMADAVRFIIAKFPGGVGKTQLMKMLYLADLEAHRFIGRSITGISYRWHDHGPFSSMLYRSIDLLKSGLEIDEAQYTSSHGGPASKFTYRGIPSISHLDEIQQILLASVIDEYGKTPLSELLEDIVYKTKPMEIAKAKNDRTSPLEMNAVDHEGSRKYGGVDLYRLIKGETEARSNLFQPIDEVERELRSLYHRDG